MQACANCAMSDVQYEIRIQRLSNPERPHARFYCDTCYRLLLLGLEAAEAALTAPRRMQRSSGTNLKRGLTKWASLKQSA